MMENVRWYTLEGIRWGLALVFGVSGVGKLIDGRGAAHLVELIFEGLPVMIGWSKEIVIVVSGAELLLAGVLILGWRLSWALGGSFGIVAGFTAALFTLLGGTKVASCGCFGAFGVGLSLEATILRNFVLIGLILLGFLLADTTREKPRKSVS